MAASDIYSKPAVRAGQDGFEGGFCHPYFVNEDVEVTKRMWKEWNPLCKAVCRQELSRWGTKVSVAVHPKHGANMIFLKLSGFAEGSYFHGAELVGWLAFNCGACRGKGPPQYHPHAPPNVGILSYTGGLFTECLGMKSICIPGVAGTFMNDKKVFAQAAAADALRAGESKILDRKTKVVGLGDGNLMVEKTSPSVHNHYVVPHFGGSIAKLVKYLVDQFETCSDINSDFLTGEGTIAKTRRGSEAAKESIRTALTNTAQWNRQHLVPLIADLDWIDPIEDHLPDMEPLSPQAKRRRTDAGVSL